MSERLRQRLVFTDLDGSLLDHDTYSYTAALPMLERLSDGGIPVIFVSSKTRSEIVELRGELGNNNPFIVENGAAVFIPEGCFSTPPANVVLREGYWVYEAEASPGTNGWAYWKSGGSDLTGNSTVFTGRGLRASQK